MRVHPTMIPTNHQLATVNGMCSMPSTWWATSWATMFFGEGAGAGAAASAVMGDVRRWHVTSSRAWLPSWVSAPMTCPFCLWTASVMRYYLRLQPIARVFGNHGRRVRAPQHFGEVHRATRSPGAERVDQVVVTHAAASAISARPGRGPALDNVVLDTPFRYSRGGISDLVITDCDGRSWIRWARYEVDIAPWRPRPASPLTEADAEAITTMSLLRGERLPARAVRAGGEQRGGAEMIFDAPRAFYANEVEARPGAAFVR